METGRLRSVLRNFDGWLASDSGISDEDRAAWCVEQLFPDEAPDTKERIAEIILAARGWDSWYDESEGEEYFERLWDWDLDSEFAQIAGRIAVVVGGYPDV